MDNKELIAALRCPYLGDAFCDKQECAWFSTLGCMLGNVVRAAADALEAAEKRIAELELQLEGAMGAVNMLDENRNNLLQEIERLKAGVSKWISVEERLPDFHEEVLIYAIGKEDGFSPVVAISEIYVFRLLPFSNGTIEWRDPWDFFSKNYEVTHWMPLPNPPEDGNE